MLSALLIYLLVSLFVQYSALGCTDSGCVKKEGDLDDERKRNLLLNDLVSSDEVNEIRKRSSGDIAKRMDLLILAARRGTSQLDNAQSNEKRLISILKALKEQAEKRQKVENKKDLSKS
ncbi:uncharacterized protein LOC142335242 [Convolutriloba macropyga]|uniref:uncharacterized protein LOC142335242 n=1 Tax=Convolutriloba macropyga TaxID=536237 RepID=UPI003F51DACD